MKNGTKIAIACGAALLLALALLPIPAVRNAGSLPGGPPAAPVPPAPVYQEIAWDQLIPKDWDPLALVRGKNLDAITDNSPQALAMLDEMREVWDNAPTVADLNGRTVRLPGYVVPLEATAGKMREFLLVPYFGACIHTPPPPANQIVHVTADEPVSGFAAMSPVWVDGTLSTGQLKTGMGASGYRLKLAKIEMYALPVR